MRSEEMFSSLISRIEKLSGENKKLRFELANEKNISKAAKETVTQIKVNMSSQEFELQAYKDANENLKAQIEKQDEQK